MPASKLFIVTVARRVRPAVSQKEIHKPLVSAGRNRLGGQELVEAKERLMKSRSEPGQASGTPPGGQGWLLVSSQPPEEMGGGGSQGKAGVSWVRGRVSAREPEISP